MKYALSLIGILITLMPSQADEAAATHAPDTNIRVACEVVKKSDAKLPPDILVSLENVGKLDTALKMGIMLGDGASYLPTALKLLITDSIGVTRIYESEGPGAIGGRIDTFAVPLPVGSTYRLLCQLDKFISTEIWQRANSIGAGNFKVAAEIANPPAVGGIDRVEENGMLESHYWHGVARSEAVSLKIP